MKRKIIFYPLILLFILFAETVFCSKLKVFYEKSSGGGYNFYAENLFPVECWVKLEFKEFKNLRTDRELPFETVVKKNSGKVFLFKAKPVSKKKRYGFRYLYRYIKGDPYKKTDSEHLYIFPYKHGSKYKISQGYMGGITHFGDDGYALDFQMKEGTHVIAARDGVVVEVKEDSNIGGPTEKYNKHGNYVLIYHSDGTFADYVHLKRNGALVEVNDVVKAGDVIGLSGNTGRSSGPHLHFSVSKPTVRGKRVSIPVKFLNHDGNPVEPLGGNFYYSTHPGKEPFRVVLGKNISDKDYNNYHKKIKRTGRIRFRSEAVDNTILVFFRNETSDRIKVEVDFNLTNLVASKILPLKRDVGPGSEVYICFFRVKDKRKGYSYSSRCRYQKIN